jgi:hypothetical protein
MRHTHILPAGRWIEVEGERRSARLRLRRASLSFRDATGENFRLWNSLTNALLLGEASRKPGPIDSARLVRQ